MRAAFFFLISGIPVMLAASARCMVGPSTRPSMSAASVRCDVWHNVPGSQATDALATPDLHRPADQVSQLRTPEFSPKFSDEWACSMSAILVPPESGQYYFYIASRDTGVLFLSTDESPEHRRYIAETPAATDLRSYRYYQSQTSIPVDLVAGRRYFIQAICKSGRGPGGISIAWMPIKGMFQAPIPAGNFRPYVGPLTTPDFQAHHVSVTLKPQASTTQPASQAGMHEFIRGAQFVVDGTPGDLSYLVRMPKAIDTSSDPLPMLIFLHGNGRQGYALRTLEQSAPMRNIEMTADLRDWLPMIVVAPELPPNWRWDTPGAGAVVNGLVEQLCQRYPRIDRSRIYLTGLSMGGKGTWLTLENSPQIYAAVAPISAVDVRPDAAPGMLKNLGNLHIICGSEDGGFTAGSKHMYEVLKPTLGDRVQLTVWEHEGHNVWDHYYSKRSFYEELLKFSLPSAKPEKQNSKSE